MQPIERQQFAEEPLEPAKTSWFHKLASLLFIIATGSAFAQIGVGAKPVAGGEVIIDGSREMLDEKWTYWEGPRFASTLPIKANRRAAMARNLRPNLSLAQTRHWSCHALPNAVCVWNGFGCVRLNRR